MPLHEQENILELLFSLLHLICMILTWTSRSTLWFCNKNTSQNELLGRTNNVCEVQYTILPFCLDQAKQHGCCEQTYFCLAITTKVVSLKPRSWRGVLDTTLYDKVCQWLATGLWFSLGTPVSSTNKTDHHDLTEILLKVASNTINQSIN